MGYFEIQAKIKAQNEVNRFTEALDYIAPRGVVEGIRDKKHIYDKKQKVFFVATAGNARWHNWEDDMRELSKDFPDVLIELSREGEDNADMLKAYFQDGKCQICRAQISYEPYDPAKLDGHSEAGKAEANTQEWDLVILRFEAEPGKASFSDELFHTIYILVDAKQYIRSGLHWSICRVPTRHGDFQSITTAALQSLGWNYRIVSEESEIPACKHIRELII